MSKGREIVVVEQCRVLANAAVASWFIEALHDFMDYHLQRALEKDFKDFKDARAREALEDNK